MTPEERFPAKNEPWPPRSVRVGLAYIGLVLVLFAFVAGASAWRTAQDRAEIDRHGVRASATVTHVDALDSTDTDTVTFADQAGRSESGVIVVDSGELRRGQAVEVVYDARHPERLHLVGDTPSPWGWFATIVGALLLIAASLGTAVAAMGLRRRRERRLFSTGPSTGRVRLEPWVLVRGNDVVTVATIVDASTEERQGVVGIPTRQRAEARDVDTWIAYGRLAPGGTVAFRAGGAELLPVGRVKAPDLESRREAVLDRSVDEPLPWRDAGEAREMVRILTATRLATPLVLGFGLLFVASTADRPWPLPVALTGLALGVALLAWAGIGEIRAVARLAGRLGAVPRPQRGALRTSLHRRLQNGTGLAEAADAAGLDPRQVEERQRFLRQWSAAWGVVVVAGLLVLGIREFVR